MAKNKAKNKKPVSKQRTLRWQGGRIKIISRQRMRKGKFAGFYVRLNGGPSFFVDTDNREEAEKQAVADFKLNYGKKIRDAFKRTIPQEEAKKPAVSNKDKYILLTDQNNSDWMTANQLKEEIFNYLQNHMNKPQEVGLMADKELKIIKGSSGDVFIIHLC